jgi:SpoVK/Ycf46/Vps4 family AAA+-type ATPase
VKILTTCIKKTPLAPDVNIEKIARDPRCTGFRFVLFFLFLLLSIWTSLRCSHPSGADIDLLHREAQTECIRLCIEEGKPLQVSNDHFEVRAFLLIVFFH